MIINIVIVLLTVAFFISTYYQNALYSTDMPWEKREWITTRLSIISPLTLAIDSYLLSQKTKVFFDHPWIDLCIFYYIIGFIFIQMTFAFWGRWKMNKYHETKN